MCVFEIWTPPLTKKRNVYVCFCVPNLNNIHKHMFFFSIFGFGRVEVVVVLSGQAGEQRMHQTPKPPQIQNKQYVYVFLLRFGSPKTKTNICLCVFVVFRVSKSLYLHGFG